MDSFDSYARGLAFQRLRELIALGRQYDLFARENPSQAAVQLAELNAPGLQENAWDLRWVPEILRAKIARVSSIIVLDLCRMPDDSEHDPTLMDVVMRAAIAAACVVAHAYGEAVKIPRSLQGRLKTLAQLVHRVTGGHDLEAGAAARAAGRLAGEPPPIIAWVPSRVRGHLINLAQVMGEGTDPRHVHAVTVIFIIGAVAAETFEPLDFSGVGSGSSLPTT